MGGRFKPILIEMTVVTVASLLLLVLLIIGASDYDFETAESVIFRRSLANIHTRDFAYFANPFFLHPVCANCVQRRDSEENGSSKGVLRRKGN